MSAQFAPAQRDAPRLPAASPVTLPEARQFDFESRAGRSYRIFLAEPQGPKPEGGWPVLYLTDANSNFPVLLAAAQRQVRNQLPLVIVGIGYPGDDRTEHMRRRWFDLTPPASPEWVAQHAPEMAKLKPGGNDELLAFINSELKPLIESAIPIDQSQQTLFGHSFGALFALHVLFTTPKSFQTYLVASPSIWWNDGAILTEERRFLERFAGKALNRRVLITAGSLEGIPRPLQGGNPAGSTNWNMVDTARAMSDRLATAGLTGFTAEFRLFPEEAHGSVILPAASRGVRFALESGSGPAARP